MTFAIRNIFILRIILLYYTRKMILLIIWIPLIVISTCMLCLKIYTLWIGQWKSVTWHIINRKFRGFFIIIHLNMELRARPFPIAMSLVIFGIFIIYCYVISWNAMRVQIITVIIIIDLHITWIIEVVSACVFMAAVIVVKLIYRWCWRSIHVVNFF